MKILSFNVENDYRDLENKCEVICDLIHKHNPEIIGLQEVIPALYKLLSNKLSLNYTISTYENTSYFNVMLILTTATLTNTIKIWA